MFLSYKITTQFQQYFVYIDKLSQRWPTSARYLSWLSISLLILLPWVRIPVHHRCLCSSLYCPVAIMMWCDDYKTISQSHLKKWDSVNVLHSTKSLELLTPLVYVKGQSEFLILPLFYEFTKEKFRICPLHTKFSFLAIHLLQISWKIEEISQN